MEVSTVPLGFPPAIKCLMATWCGQSASQYSIRCQSQRYPDTRHDVHQEARKFGSRVSLRALTIVMDGLY